MYKVEEATQKKEKGRERVVDGVHIHEEITKGDAVLFFPVFDQCRVGSLLRIPNITVYYHIYVRRSLIIMKRVPAAGQKTKKKKKLCGGKV